MIIFPAIDIKDGRCVRLYKGEYSTAQQVADSVPDTAVSFAKAGAQWLHMVDLDGAKEGRPVNTDIFLRIARETGLRVQLGGGIRDMETVRMYLQNGVSRVILGSAALSDPDFVREAVSVFGERIAVGIDARGGMAAAHGWTQTSSVHYLELAKAMEQAGVEYIIFTDISRDGTLEGPETQQLIKLRDSVSCKITASGGIRDINDIRKLAGLGLYGAICGKSLYSGTLDLERAICEGGGVTAREKRIIPCLDVRDGRVVKGVNFAGIKDVGDTVECAMLYEQQGADELIFLDIAATVDGRSTMTEWVSRVARSISIPLCVGGGISDVEQIDKVLQAGADKVSINSAAVRNPQLIREAANRFGSRRVVVAIDVACNKDGRYTVLISGGRKDTGIDALEWAKKAVELGAGELLVTSLDADGTKGGFDLEITRLIAKAVEVPVIASGGCGKLEHFSDVFEQTGADAALAASLFHYRELTVDQVKGYLSQRGIPVRI